jgi:cytochrome c oxidase cbb3-type subunit III
MRVACSTFLFAALVLAQHPEGKDDESKVKNPLDGQPEAIEEGRLLYMNSCSGCHGPTAEGGRGPRIAQNGDIRGANDGRLFNSIKNGVRGSDMPPSTYPDDKIWQLVSFVKSVNAPAYEAKVSGSADSGRAIFSGKGGCSGCHMIRGQGGALGPDLTNAGMARSVPQLREAILKPSEKPTEGFSAVTVRTKKGETIKGVAKDNTNYNINVMDGSGRIHLLSKIDLSEVVFSKRSAMPEDYGQRFSKQEIDDLIAFLARQTVRPPAPKEEKK